MRRFRKSALMSPSTVNTDTNEKPSFKSYVNNFLGENNELYEATIDGGRDDDDLGGSAAANDKPPPKTRELITNPDDDTASSEPAPSSNSLSFHRLSLTANRTDSYQLNEAVVQQKYIRRSSRRRSSLTNFIDYREKETDLAPPIKAVFRYNLHMNKTKGTIGDLMLTTLRIKFINYWNADTNERPQSCDNILDQDSSGSSLINQGVAGLRQRMSTMSLPPFDVHPLTGETRDICEQDIDLLNIDTIRVDQGPKHTTLNVYCNDFRCIEFELKNSEAVKILVEQLEVIKSSFGGVISGIQGNSVSNGGSLTASGSSIGVGGSGSIGSQSSHVCRAHENALLWMILHDTYRYRWLNEWKERESYWFESEQGTNGTKILKITQCNENTSVCSTLPPAFITVNNLSDAVLISISRHSNQGRMPVVSYCHRVDSVRRHLLIRCSAINDDVTMTLTQAVNPLEIIDTLTLLPSYQKLVSAFGKLKKACSINADQTRFLSQTGKWLKIVAKVLSVVNDMKSILEKGSSLVIVEDCDNLFNPLISSLIQIVLDKNRRTFTGFESLVSKEWLYLCGLVKTPMLRSPDIVIFTLFLDCVWQLICQNPYSFKFTSLYLIRLYDYMTIPFTRDEADRLKNRDNEPPKIDENMIPVTLDRLDTAQLLFLFNAFYNRAPSAERMPPILVFKYDISSIVLWKPLYLRWLPLDNQKQYYNDFPEVEYIYFDYLLNSTSDKTES